jgi:hypothetical protein
MIGYRKNNRRQSSPPSAILFLVPKAMLEAKFSRAFRFVRTVWIAKIYRALPNDETAIPEYFLDAELEQFLNDTIEECYSVIGSVTRAGKRSV